MGWGRSKEEDHVHHDDALHSRTQVNLTRKRVMKHTKEQQILLWTLSVWVCVLTSPSAAVPFGERIRPLAGTVPLASHCAKFPNKTMCGKNEHSVKIEKRIDAGQVGKQAITSTPKHPKGDNSLDKTQQTSSPAYSGAPKENISNRGATFFFTQVEPHRYEYRAMFQHHNFHQTEFFQPLVHNFNPFTHEFPPLPVFQDFPQIYPEHKDPFPQIYPEHKDPFLNFNPFAFPTLPPAMKRVWEPDNEVQTQKPVLDENLDRHLVKNYDVTLGHGQYPKIFRFNEERINIEEFDREKKLRLYKLSQEDQNEILEPENVKRNQLLILHGGIFTVQEPPLYNKNIKKVRKSQIFGV